MQRSLHRPATGRASGLLRTDGCPSVGRCSRQWPFGASSIHNVPAVRSISFARVLPQLALKMARLPALFGASMIAGLAYIQYQAARKLKGLQVIELLLSMFCRGRELCDGHLSAS